MFVHLFFEMDIILPGYLSRWRFGFFDISGDIVSLEEYEAGIGFLFLFFIWHLNSFGFLSTSFAVYPMDT